ncbi:hypothetical protein VZ94_12865 [Methylocucumis oryzae]|uniref:Uncharacterized protein n=1 Tax=Methylocucumis oryzae TaxID=1632867 RepID=A0A0F3IHD5_9GAMM|nr:hypothetical protein VZ94_12865 [Methylocucumis oryzae]
MCKAGTFSGFFFANIKDKKETKIRVPKRTVFLMLITLTKVDFQVFGIDSLNMRDKALID